MRIAPTDAAPIVSSVSPYFVCAHKASNEGTAMQCTIAMRQFTPKSSTAGHPCSRDIPELWPKRASTLVSSENGSACGNHPLERRQGTKPAQQLPPGAQSRGLRQLAAVRGDSTQGRYVLLVYLTGGRIAITQARFYPPARAYLERKHSEGKSRREALRCWKRLLARVVFNTLKTNPALT